MKALNSNKKNIIIIISIAVLTIVLEFAMISRVTINLKGKFNIKTRQALRRTTLFAAPFPATWIRFSIRRAALSQGISMTHGATRSPLPMQAAKL